MHQYAGTHRKGCGSTAPNAFGAGTGGPVGAAGPAAYVAVRQLRSRSGAFSSLPPEGLGGSAGKLWIQRRIHTQLQRLGDAGLVGQCSPVTTKTDGQNAAEAF